MSCLHNRLHNRLQNRIQNRLQDWGFGLSFTAATLWLLGPAAGPVLAGQVAAGEPPGGAPAASIVDRDPYASLRAFWPAVTGVEFSPGHSGMALWQELPRDQWIIAVVDSSREQDAGVATLTYDEAARFDLPLVLFPEGTYGAALSAGILTGIDGQEHVIIGLTAEVNESVDETRGGPAADGFTALPFAPISFHADLTTAVATAEAASEMFLEAAEDGMAQQSSAPLGGHQAPEPAPRRAPASTTPLGTGGAGRAGGAIRAGGGALSCHDQWRLAIAACNKEFVAEILICVGAAATCYTWRCRGITVGCFLFGIPIGPGGCYAVCIAICFLVFATCVGSFALKRAACIDRADAARMACDPFWTPPQLKWTCFPCEEGVP